MLKSTGKSKNNSLTSLTQSHKNDSKVRIVYREQKASCECTYPLFPSMLSGLRKESPAEFYLYLPARVQKWQARTRHIRLDWLKLFTFKMSSWGSCILKSVSVHFISECCWCQAHIISLPNSHFVCNLLIGIALWRRSESHRATSLLLILGVKWGYSVRGLFVLIFYNYDSADFNLYVCKWS